jgi:hypothetical protein
MKNAYEGYGVRPDGEIFTVETMECETDEDALYLAKRYSNMWRSTVRVWRTPEVNESGESSFNRWPNEMVFVGEVVMTRTRSIWLWAEERIRREIADARYWRWVIVLIAVELWRLHVELAHFEIERDMQENIHTIEQIIIDRTCMVVRSRN